MSNAVVPMHELLGKNVASRQKAEFAQQHDAAKASTPPFIDIDIGTAGVPMPSNRHLVTFDPFDLPVFKHNYERHAFAISPLREGNATFYINREKPGCSSLLPINPAFSTNETVYMDDCLPEHGCHPPAACTSPECLRPCSTLKHHLDHFFHIAVLRCRRPLASKGGLEERVVPTIRLSTFLKIRGVQRIGFLKIDAQGGDLSLVEDVFKRTDIPIDHLRVECQLLDRVPPQYVHEGFLPNDCYAHIEMVRRRRPELMGRVAWSGSNCHIAEYNLDFWRNETAPATRRRLEEEAHTTTSHRCEATASNPFGYAGVRSDSPLLLQDGPPIGDGPSCSLDFLSDRLYLLTFLSALESSLAGHFVRHYVSRIGVRPQHIRAFVHEGDAAEAVTQLTVRRFTDAGVPSAFVRRLTGVFVEAKRFEAINGEIQSLPNGSWVIHADVDEFFRYPCALRQQIGRPFGTAKREHAHEVFCAEMSDALALDGLVGELPDPAATDTDLDALYPHACYLRQHFWRNYTFRSPPLSKVVLMKIAFNDGGTRRTFVDSHHIAGYRRFGFKCRAIGYFAHYTLTLPALRLLRNVKLAKGHQYEKDPFSKGLYTGMAHFLEEHRHEDARSHPWCQRPPSPAPDNVTVFTNAILDYCGKPLTRLGSVRAV